MGEAKLKGDIWQRFFFLTLKYMRNIEGTSKVKDMEKMRYNLMEQSS